MKTSIIRSAVQASLIALLATQTVAQSSAAASASASASATATATGTAAGAALGPITTLSCYKSPDPLTQDNTDQFQTDGSCQKACGNKNQAVMAITGGSTCYCGDEIPGLDQQVDESKCNSPCQGFGSKTCGGIGYWQVYLTGLTGDVHVAPNSTESSSSSSSNIPSSTKPAQTVVITQSASASPSKNSDSDSGPNKVGIAVGVVVGIIALAGIVGAAVFFARQRRRQEIEEEHKAQAAISSFVNANKASDSKSTVDQRLDPTAQSARRESVGSIADERDFSRRILQVRNPDRGSMNSVA